MIKNKKKAYIILNYLNGWKVVLDDVRVVDCTKPIFDSDLINNDGLKMCKKFCNDKNIQIVRVCK